MKEIPKGIQSEPKTSVTPAVLVAQWLEHPTGVMDGGLELDSYTEL